MSGSAFEGKIFLSERDQLILKKLDTIITLLSATMALMANDSEAVTMALNILHNVQKEVNE